MRRITHLAQSACLILLFACQPESAFKKAPDYHLTTMAGELSSQSVILQCRLGATDTLVNQDIPGKTGIGWLEVAPDASFDRSQRSESLLADYTNDFIIKATMANLRPHTQYYYRAAAVPEGRSDTAYSVTGTFQTLPQPDTLVPVTFVTATCLNYEKFYGIGRAANGGKGKIVAEPATGTDRELGFEAFEAVPSLSPMFFIANGDVVYYDSPTEKPELRATNRATMQAKWHRYFAMPRNQAMMREVPIYYTKDDHDYRFNDADTTDEVHPLPTHQEGIKVFQEQVPVVDPNDQAPKTYRTHRAGKLLQIWLLEGRDYRSPNTMEDGPGKTLWGNEQREWLQQTLLESEAVFKVIVSPTPIIGPDDAYKKDNHTNPGGFRYERDAFFAWLTEHQFSEKGLYFLCGDRHWQYHSVHPAGFEEFSSGAFVDQNARPGRPPGDPKSTDPEAILKVPYVQLEGDESGGFLQVNTLLRENQPLIQFVFRDTEGKLLYQVERTQTML